MLTQSKLRQFIKRSDPTFIDFKVKCNKHIHGPIAIRRIQNFVSGLDTLLINGIYIYSQSIFSVLLLKMDIITRQLHHVLQNRTLLTCHAGQYGPHNWGLCLSIFSSVCAFFSAPPLQDLTAVVLQELYVCTKKGFETHFEVIMVL